MQTGAIQTGIGTAGAAAAGPGALDDPDPDDVFALGGTTYGMAEESLAFYALVIAVMIAAGYDALTGAASSCWAAVSARSARRSTRSPPASPPASPASPISDGFLAAAGHPHRRAGDRHLLRAALRRPGRRRIRPGRSSHDMKEENEAHFSARRPRRHGRHDRPAQADPGRLRAGVRRDDVRRHPLGGPGHPRSRRCGGGSRR